jgi:carbon storage regulator
MLVVSRKPGESVYVGEDIVVKVIEWRRGQVRLGIEAPKDVPILRDEIKAAAAAGRLDRLEDDLDYRESEQRRADRDSG